MKNRIIGISLSLLVVVIYFGSFPGVFAGPDITPPTLNPVSIASNNADATLAIVGDTVTLTFTADENIMTPVVTIGGNAADTVTGGPIIWSATRAMQAGDTEAPIAFTIDFTDLAGNMGIQITATTDASSVTFDETVPTLNPVSIVSSNANMTLAKVGDNVTLTFTENEDLLLTPVVTIGGQAVVPVEGPTTTWTAIRNMTGVEPNGPLAFTIDFTDLAGNAGTTVVTTTDVTSVTFDKTAPMVTSGAITAGNTATIVYDEPVISSMGDYTLLNLNPSGARAITGHGGTGTDTISLTFGAPAAGVGENGTVNIGVGVTDLAGNAITPIVGQILADGQAPSLTPVSITSDNANTTLAKVGDTVTLTFTADENIMTPVVTIGGQAAVEAGAGTAWTATRNMTGVEPNGPLAFTIDFTDLAGNAGIQVTGTTDASSVTFDDILPILNTVLFASNNANTTLAKVGDTVTLTFTENEDLLLTPVVTINSNPIVPVEFPTTVWTATRVMLIGDSEGPIPFTIDFTDLVGNAGIQVTASSVTFDKTVPNATSGAITAGNTATIQYDEPVISVIGDYANLVVGGASRNVNGSTSGSATIGLTFDAPISNGNDTGSVDILAGLTDLAGNAITPVVGLVLADGQIPSLNPVTITSSNVDPVWAKVGDNVTLTFTANENIMTPTVTIGGQAVVPTGGPTVWTTTRNMTGVEPNGPLAFTIDFTDLAGNAGTQVTGTTDASNVTFDDILPTVTSSAFTSGSIVTIVYNEPVITVIGDYSALTSGSWTGNIISFAIGPPGTVLLTVNFGPGNSIGVDAVGNIIIGAGITDRAGNVFNMPGTYVIADGQTPFIKNTGTTGTGSAPSFSSSSTDSSITMSPISINGQHYNFIQSGNLVPIGSIPIEQKDSEGVEPITNVIKVGQLTQLKFVTYTIGGPDHIQHAAIYTNLKGTSIKPSSDTIAIIYDKGKELKILDKKNILSHADIKVSGEGNRVDIKVNFIFSENMDTSDILLRMWDTNRFALYAHIEDAWKVIGKIEPDDLSLLAELNSENPVIEIVKEETVSAIKKWAGYDLEVISDSQLLSTIGINGDNIPKWFKKSAKWLVNEQISFEEFIDALRFVHSIKA